MDNKLNWLNKINANEDFYGGQHHFVELTWNNAAERATDVVTGYADFEGYKIYKSVDGGLSWRNDSGKIFDNTGVQVGWRPIKQFDLNLN